MSTMLDDVNELAAARITALESALAVEREKVRKLREAAECVLQRDNLLDLDRLELKIALSETAPKEADHD